MNTSINMQINHINAAYFMQYTSLMPHKHVLITVNEKVCRDMGTSQYERKDITEMVKIYSISGTKNKPIQTSIVKSPDNVPIVHAKSCSIDLQNKDYPRSCVTVLVLQNIDVVLYNKTNTKIDKHTYLIATDFLTSSVTDSLEGTYAKREVAITALMLNSGIDSWVRKETDYDQSEKKFELADNCY